MKSTLGLPVNFDFLFNMCGTDWNEVRYTQYTRTYL